MLEHVTLYASENTMGLSMGLTHDVLKFASDPSAQTAWKRNNGEVSDNRR